MDEEKCKAFQESLFSYIFDTLVGQERGLYRILAGAARVEEIKGATPILKVSITQYLNQTYKSLIRRNDEYVVNRYDEMCSYYNHSKVCLLNIVMSIMQNLLMRIPRESLNITSLEHYDSSLRDEYYALIEEYKAGIKGNPFNCCKGEDITNLNPNEDLFVVQSLERN